MRSTPTHRWPLLRSVALLLMMATATPVIVHGQLTHVGRSTCIECHTTQHSLWLNSHHDLAMTLPGEDSVRALFDGSEVSTGGVVSRFVMKEDRPVIEVEDSSGSAELAVRYFFGTSPCQQVLVDGVDGRLQSYPIAWATEEAKGTPRWYSLFPGEKTPPGDPLHWNGILNNWNHMCAECHSTGVEKNFDASDDSFHTSWKEIDVSCEACHGPGSDHVKIMRAAEQNKEVGKIRSSGFPVDLKRDGATWVRPEGEKVARRTVPRTRHEETETCARCHSRRSSFQNGSTPGQDLSDTHLLSLLSEGLYHDDGQILDEVYVHGSFLQSKMYSEGVTCSDCHDAHSGELHLPGNSLCISCHDATAYDQPTHHHHVQGTEGASCVNCHMVARTYMGVDPRRDHSFRVPRPDLSVRIGTPNACNGCHEDQQPTWAAEKVAEWYPDGRSGDFHWGESLHAARNGSRVAPELIRMVLENEETPAIVRATALSELIPFLDGTNIDLLQVGFSDADPLVRRQAVLGLDGIPLQDTFRILLNSLTDPSIIVRSAAAELLSPLEKEIGSNPELPESILFNKALSEYLSMQRVNGDRPESHVNLGSLAIRRGDLEEAVRCYREALKRTPSFGPASVNLADALRGLQRDQEGVEVLSEAITHVPEDAGLHHALGLALVRIGEKGLAIDSLKRAVELAPGAPRYALVHAVALEDSGKTLPAIVALEEALKIHPQDPALKAALEEFKATETTDEKD